MDDRDLVRRKKHVSRKLWLVVAVVVLLSVLGSWAVARDNSWESPTSLDEFIACGDAALQWQPAVDDGTIVWGDARNADYDIYGYDLGSQAEFAISTATGGQSSPDIYGDVVVWQDARDPLTSPDVYGYDLSTSTEFPICTESHGQGTPSIDGNYVVWQDSRAASDNQDIYGYDLSTHTEFPICTAGGSQVGPTIYGDIVVWMDYRNEPNPAGCWPACNTDIYGYDLSTATEFEICTEGSFQGYPAIYGDTVIWIDQRNGNYDVYAYNLTTGQESAICTEEHDQIGASIGEQWIAWADMRNEVDPAGCGQHCNYDIYVYERSTGTEFAAVTEPHWQFQQAIQGNLLLWTDKRNEPDPDNCWPDCNYDIYGAAIVSGGASFPSGETQTVDLDEDIILQFTLPMDTSTVTYECDPDPGGWSVIWTAAALPDAGNTVMTLSHDPFTLSTTYLFTVTGGVDVFGQAIEPFGMSFTTYAVRLYLPAVTRDQ